VAKRLIIGGYKIVMLGTDVDKKEAEKIKKYVPDSIDLTGKTNLGETAYILSHSKALITGDSGLMHIAYAVGTPTVTLFGAGIEKKWAPRGNRHVVINKRLDCSPCTRFGYTPRCRKGVECLASISVGEVLRAVEMIMYSKSDFFRNEG
jgi:ADP-heptose:LPS heptosyltransferase